MAAMAVKEMIVKYMMIVCYDPAIDAAQAEGGMDIDSWVKEMDGRGVRLEGHPLQPSDATTVRVRAGEVLVSDGPFAETKELMVGYDILECADLDEAIEVASKHPLARRGAMELRPFGDAPAP
ncbi:MAG TPA: YciI family protein [Streptosporangiaceae bacterium]